MFLTKHSLNTINPNLTNKRVFMKKLAIVIGCLIPVLSFAGPVYNYNPIEIYQEQCAKEKDPVKRQNSCHMLDRHTDPQSSIPDFHQETITV